MRVSFLSASLSRKSGGVFDSMRSLAGCLQLHQNCKVAAFGLYDEQFENDASLWNHNEVFAHKVFGPKIFGYSPNYGKSVRQWKPDVLHIHGLWMYPSIISSQVAHKTTIPVVISPHGMLDSWAIRNSKWKKKIAAALYENRHLAGAACMHALNDSELSVIREYGLNNPVCVIPNGVHIAKEKIEGEPNWHYLVPKESKVLLYLGRIHPKKGIKELILGWHLANQNYSDFDEWHLVIAGWSQGGYEAELKRIVSELGLFDRIHFVGPQYNNDKYLTYQAADAFVLPSYSEGLPMVVLEAWSHKLPVMKTSNCNLPEGFSNMSAIKIMTNLESISIGLINLFSLSDTERIEMGNRGFALVSEKYNWKIITAEMKKVYLWLLGEEDLPQSVSLY